MSNEVEVVGAPGFVNRFRAKLIGNVGAVDDRGALAVVVTPDGCTLVVPSSTVRKVES